MINLLNTYYHACLFLKLSVIESGDNIFQLCSEGVLLVANHQSTADTPLVIMSLWGQNKTIGNPLWIMDYYYRFIPTFGLICWLRRDFFIRTVSMNCEICEPLFYLIQQALFNAIIIYLIQ